MRFFLGVGTSCSNTGLFGEMGWVPLQAEIFMFWHRICSLPTHRLPNIVHRWSSQKGLGNWADKTIKLFPDINLSNFSKTDRNSFQKEAWNRILQVEYSKWLDNLNPKMPLAQRICQLCNEGIEDETHFLSFCLQLTQERIALFKTMEGVLGSTFYSLSPAEKTLIYAMWKRPGSGKGCTFDGPVSEENHLSVIKTRPMFLFYFVVFPPC